MEQLEQVWYSMSRMLPNLITGILLVLVAWVVATLVKKAVEAGLEAVNLDNKLSEWGAVSTPEQGRSSIEILARVLYYLVWILFLPGIFETFGLTSVYQPIQNMVNTGLAYLPNIIGADRKSVV